MKILQVHNRYKQRGGEDVVCDQEYKLLIKNDFNVRRYIVDNRSSLKSIWSKLKLLFQTHYSKESKRTISDILLDEEISLMHVHNFFPLLTPSIFDACLEKGIPSVMTLHNYRLIHPNGLLLNNNQIDERSVQGSAYECVLDGVYRNSVLQTLIVAHMIEFHRRKGTWENKVDKFIALTEFAKSKFVEGGIPKNKITVKPNFIEDPVQTDESLHQKEDHYVFIGRISQEKGIETLIDACENISDSKVFIFGEGPLFKSLKKRTEALDHIVWMGYKNRNEVFNYLEKAKALLFPSVWYEGFPMTIVEALAFGVPVITSNIGSQSEIIEDNVTGLHFEAGNANELQKRIKSFDDNPEMVKSLSKNARNEYLDHYTPKKNIKQLTQIYCEVIE